MAVDKKEKAALQAMWEEAEQGGGADMPDGTYQFKVLGKSSDKKKVTGFQWSGKGKPTFKTQLKCVGGTEEYVGTELELNDNLETSENMGWFKKKLNRLNITLPEDIGDILDGTVAEQMAGKTFEGQVKTKNDFINVYVNRLIGEAGEEASDEKPEKEEAEEKPEDKPESSGDLEEGTQVAWGDKTGEVIEVVDEDTVRVKTEDGKVYRKDKSDLEVVEAEKSAKKSKADEEEPEKPEAKGDEFVVPEAEQVDEMTASEVKTALKELGFDATELKQPRVVLAAFCALAHDEDAELELSQLTALATALDVTPKKGESIKVTRVALSKAVSKRLG